LQDTPVDEIWIVYDGRCPLCSAYVRHLRLKQVINKVHLVDARTDSPLVREARALRLDLDEGILVKLGDAFYHGAEGMHTLALLSTRSDMFNRLNRSILSSRTRARFLYPILRGGRNILLFFLGRKRLK
jgi:DCC1-like thiol-disulfide oxidoreductase